MFGQKLLSENIKDKKKYLGPNNFGPKHYRSTKLKGGSKKTSLNLRNSFCLIYPATNMIDNWNIIHLKSEIHSSIRSKKTFLYDIRELSYMQNNIGYQISRI